MYGREGEEEYESDQGEVFLEDEDVIQEIHLDEEDLPDRDDGNDSDVDYEEPDDSMHVFKGHTDELYTVACSPTDASLVATGGKDDRGFLWKIGFVDYRIELQGHTDSVSSLAFSFDGRFLASGSFDGAIQVWDTSLGIFKCKLEGSGAGIEWLKWHPRGQFILAGTEDSNVTLWNAEKNQFPYTFSGHASTLTCGDFTPNGKFICTGSDDGTLRIWDPQHIRNSEIKESIRVERGHPYHTDGLTCLTITDNSTIAITGSKDSSIHMVNISNGKVIRSLNAHTDSVECIGLSRGYPWAASGGLDRKLLIWDLQHFDVRCTCDHEEGVTCLLWLGASRHVATGCVDGKVRIWDAASGTCVRTFRGHTDVVQSLAASADGNRLVSVSLDRTARVFDISEFC